MKLKRPGIATGLGLVIFMATMIGGPVRVSQAQNDQGGVTLASLAGKFAGRGSGFFTVCFNAGFTGLQDCATAPHFAPQNVTGIEHFTRDEAGNSCKVRTNTFAPVSGSTSPAGVSMTIMVGTPISFDPTTGSGTDSFSEYHGGNCDGAVFDSTGATLVRTGTISFDVSDSGNRIELINTGFNPVTSAFSVAGSLRGLVFSETAIRQGTQN